MFGSLSALTCCLTLLRKTCTYPRINFPVQSTPLCFGNSSISRTQVTASLAPERVLRFFTLFRSKYSAPGRFIQWVVSYGPTLHGIYCCRSWCNMVQDTWYLSHEHHYELRSGSGIETKPTIFLRICTTTMHWNITMICVLIWVFKRSLMYPDWVVHYSSKYWAIGLQQYRTPIRDRDVGPGWVSYFRNGAFYIH